MNATSTSRRLVAAGLTLLLAATAPAQKQKPGEKPPEPAPAPAAAPVSPDLAKEAQALEKALGCKMAAVVEGKRFDLIGPFSPAQARPLIEAAEQALKIFCDETGAKDEVLFPKGRALIVVAPSKKDYEKLGSWYGTYYEAPWASLSIGHQPMMPFDAPRCLIACHLKPYDVAALRHIVVHGAGNLFASRFKFNNNFSPPWLLEGMACHLEMKVCSSVDVFGFLGGVVAGPPGKNGASAGSASLKAAPWKAAVKADAKTSKPFAKLIELSMASTNSNDAGKMWSVVEWMAAQGPAKFGAFLAALKREWPREIKPEWTPEKTQAHEKAWLEAFGEPMSSFDKTWSAFVAGW